MPDPLNQDVTISSGEKLSKDRSAFRKTSERIFSFFLEDKKSGFLENLQMQLDRAEMDLSSAAYTSEVFFSGLIVGIIFAIVALTAYLHHNVRIDGICFYRLQVCIALRSATTPFGIVIVKRNLTVRRKAVHSVYLHLE